MATPIVAGLCVSLGLFLVIASYNLNADYFTADGGCEACWNLKAVGDAMFLMGIVLGLNGGDSILFRTVVSLSATLAFGNAWDELTGCNTEYYFMEYVWAALAVLMGITTVWKQRKKRG